MSKRQAPYTHSDGSGCWTTNCSIGHHSAVTQAALSGNVSAYLSAKASEKTVKPDAKALLAMFGQSGSTTVTKPKKLAKAVTVPEWKQGFGSRPTSSEYYMSHRAPDGLDDDESAKGAHELAKIFPSDVMEHPDWYTGDLDRNSVNIMKRIQGNPDALVTIYRSAPHGVSQINNGDWVTMSKSYALQHGMQDDAADDWPVLEAKIPAKYLWTEGNDLNEFGVSFPE